MSNYGITRLCTTHVYTLGNVDDFDKEMRIFQRCKSSLNYLFKHTFTIT